jgi:hypothetical protein
MKKNISKISWFVIFAFIVSSCDSFLEEEPKTFLSPDFYFQSENQISAAVNGTYSFLDDGFNGNIGPGTQTYLLMEYLPGYGNRPAASADMGLNQAITLSVADNNSYTEAIWRTGYSAIENCNSVLEGIQNATPDIIGEIKKNNFLGEVYFFRAYHYFNLVRLFGEIPLKLNSTKSLSDTEIELSSVDAIYAQIEEDLLNADVLMVNNSWSNMEGRVARGAVKSLLAKVYLTMADYPLQKGNEYYQKAYEQANAVVASSQFYLFDDYSQLREVANENLGEYILMIQRESQNAGSPVHTNMLPYPAPEISISANSTVGGALAPAQAFYDSYTLGDRRVDEKGYYYTEHAALDNPGTIVDLDRPYIYKFWDQEAAETGKSGRNYPLITYADLLLILSEAKVKLDGGNTNDKTAIDAYYQVRSRANPDELKPTLLSAEMVLKERFWEICFEGQTWYDMLRTRKGFNPITGTIVDMIGYQTPAHPEGIAFKEKDLLFPYPAREKRLNPNLVRN